MLNRLISWAPTLRLAYLATPIIIFFTRGRLATARLGYLIYSSNTLGLTRLAAASSAHAYPSVANPTERALLRMCWARLAFDAGNRLDAWESESSLALDACDAAIARDEPPEVTADLLFSALCVLFHPAVHQGNRPSPFVDDPNLTAAFMSRQSIQSLCSAPGITPRPEAAGARNRLRESANETDLPAVSQPIRLLVLTDTNFNFAGPMIDAWGADPAVELRTRDLTAEGVDRSWWHPLNTIRDRISGTAPAAPAFLADDLKWADVVFVEWAEALAARLSGADLNARLVVRLHKYEAFIFTPTLTRWENVDSLVTITPYMTKLLGRTVPGIAARTTISMVPNVTDLRRFELTKSAQAARTIGLVQFASVVKDPLWALDVLSHLRAQDPFWKLALIGREFSPEGTTEEAREYFARFDARVREHGDAVEFLGHRTDLPVVFQDIGVILSSSRVEGSPVSVQEGLASGAFPVIRDWPILQGLGAASSLYPAEWIVQTPEEAARRISTWAVTATQPVDEAVSREMALTHNDAAVTMPLLNRVVLQRGELTTG